MNCVNRTQSLMGQAHALSWVQFFFFNFPPFYSTMFHSIAQTDLSGTNDPPALAF